VLERNTFLMPAGVSPLNRGGKGVFSPADRL